MTDAWLSPGLPADRAELASALPTESILTGGAAADADPPYVLAPDGVANGAMPIRAAPSAMRTRLLSAGAMLAGLAIGGIVIASTEGSSSASATGGGNLGGAGMGTQGGAGPPGNLNNVANTAAGQEIIACLRKNGVTRSVNQLLQSRSDPKLAQAFMTCLAQLRNSGGATPNQTPNQAPNQTPNRTPSQPTARP